MRHGLTNRQIAELEGISLDGVKYHVANAIAKLGLAHRKALRHWTGFPVDSAQNQGAQRMSTAFDIQGLGQVARSVHKLEQSTTWYRDTLGLTHLYTFGNMAFFDLGGTRLMLTESEAVNAQESLLYLKVDDIAATQTELASRGVEFSHAPHMIHKHEDGSEEWMAFIVDLEGRPMGLMSVVPARTP